MCVVDEAWISGIKYADYQKLVTEIVWVDFDLCFYLYLFHQIKCNITWIDGIIKVNREIS